MARQLSEVNSAELTTVFEKKKNKVTKSKAENFFRKYRIKISMFKPYETVDFWIRKPHVNNVLEVFIDELYSPKLREYFKIEVSEVQNR